MQTSRNRFTLHSYRSLSDADSSYLDMLRGATALAVLVGHENQIIVAPLTTALYPYTGLIAQLSVMVFFVLSGFLIGKSITRATARGGFSAVRYAADRATRILPPLVFSVLLVLLLAALAPHLFPSGSSAFLSAPERLLARHGFTVRWQEVVGSLTLLNGFGMPGLTANAALWSLPFEVWLYVLAALYVMSRGTKRILIVFVILFLILSRLNWSFAVYSLVWLAGFLLCLLHNNDALSYVTAKLKIAFTSFAFLALVLAVGYVVRFTVAGPGARYNVDLVVAYNLCAGLAVACALGLTLGRIKVSSPFLKRSAHYSYTLYVIHFPILLFVFGIWQAAIQSSLWIALSIACASSIAIVWFAGGVARITESREVLRAMRAFLTPTAPVKK